MLLYKIVNVIYFLLSLLQNWGGGGGGGMYQVFSIGLQKTGKSMKA